jgi:hypothetical protein
VGVDHIDLFGLEHTGELKSNRWAQALRYVQRGDRPTAGLDFIGHSTARAERNEAESESRSIGMPGKLGQQPLHTAGFQLQGDVNYS